MIDLIIEARNNKRDAFFVPSAGFDEVMLSIMENCFYDDLDKRTIIENINWLKDEIVDTFENSLLGYRVLLMSFLN